ncbi:hypothetical protein BH23PAT2_BH23PAT2_08330 [soil metagenome]
MTPKPQGNKTINKIEESEMEKQTKYGYKWFSGHYKELTVFVWRFQFRFSRPQTALWYKDKTIYSFGNGKR